jgi:tRNA A37 threonylcarbamoyladenosine synthetase subunit TsaC/SUA5/YrdC
MTVTAGDPAAFADLVRVLRAGGVAIAPGDTMYGLIGAVPEAGARLRAVKGRGKRNPLSSFSRIPDGFRVFRKPRFPRAWPDTGRGPSR